MNSVHLHLRTLVQLVDKNGNRCNIEQVISESPAQQQDGLPANFGLTGE